MTLNFTPKSFVDLELRRLEPTSEGVRVYVLLPSLEELLGQADFAHRDPIFLPGCRRPLDGWAMFGSARQRELAVH